jgi:aspartyl-tRNA synthetase
VQFLWIVDFPLFEESGDTLVSSHHPFTAPLRHDEAALRDHAQPRAGSDAHARRSALLNVRGQHYDLVRARSVLASAL